MQNLVKYLESLGIEVHTSTKARGHNGFYLKNRIDISKNLSDNMKKQVLLHEFTHFIHSKLEADVNKNYGSINVIFNSDNPILLTELIKVTNFVDKNSLCEKLKNHKEIVKSHIKESELIIKKDYPKFLRSKKFKEFDKYIRRSDAKYLLKYDRIKLIKGFFNKNVQIYTINNIEQDFPDMPRAFSEYIKLRSYQKKQSRISARINKNLKYYTRPTELFARFVEGLYIDKNYVENIAPTCTKTFYDLLNQNYYYELKTVLELCVKN